MNLVVPSLISFPQNYYAGKICLHLPFGLCCLASQSFPGGSAGRNLPVNAGDMGLMARLGRSPGKGNGNPFQYFCKGNLMDRGA